MKPTPEVLTSPARPVVDMSPAAIERRLATVGALHRLMRSLMTAKPVPPR